jgi:hypothetical protein
MKNKLLVQGLVLVGLFGCDFKPLLAGVNDAYCVTNWCEVFRSPTGSIAYTNVVVWPDTNVCLGSWVCAWPEAAVTSDTGIAKSVWSPTSTNCPTVYWTNTYTPFFITNWWVLSYSGYSADGEGSSCYFLPTNCGEGSITFYGTWRNSDPCTGQYIGGGTISKSTSFKVTNVEITPASTNALINKCQETNRSVTFCLTNSCYPGGVTWSIFPTLTNGAAISGSGGCVSVTIGDVAQDYTITATSNDNTNCSSSATLSVARDCECTNHVKNPNLMAPPGVNGIATCGASGQLPWDGPVTNYPCGSSAQLVCAPCNQANSNMGGGTCFIFYVNGVDVGHCVYGGSSITPAGYYECNCGDLIIGSIWTIKHTGPAPGPGAGCGYTLATDCGVRNGPNCFEANGAPRACSTTSPYDY